MPQHYLRRELVIRRQFKIADLFFGTAVVAVLTAVSGFCLSQYGLFGLLVLLVFPISLAGVAGICFAALTAFTIVISKDDGNRSDNLARCSEWAIFSGLALVPLLIVFAVLLLLR